MTRKNLFLSLFVTVVVSSCDPGVEYKRIIKNNSNYNLTIHILGDTVSGCNYYFTSDSFLIKSDSEMVIGEASAWGFTNEYKDCESCADSIIVKVEGNDTLKSTINFNDPAFWTFKILSGHGRGGACECRLTVNNNDFQ